MLRSLGYIITKFDLILLQYYFASDIDGEELRRFRIAARSRKAGWL